MGDGREPRDTRRHKDNPVIPGLTGNPIKDADQTAAQIRWSLEYADLGMGLAFNESRTKNIVDASKKVEQGMTGADAKTYDERLNEDLKKLGLPNLLVDDNGVHNTVTSMQELKAANELVAYGSFMFDSLDNVTGGKRDQKISREDVQTLLDKTLHGKFDLNKSQLNIDQENLLWALETEWDKPWVRELRDGGKYITWDSLQKTLSANRDMQKLLPSE